MICGNRVGFRLPAAFLNRCLAVSLFVSALLMIAQQL
jgi:hypothetical protein